ncbi:hypothetical protein JRO89_XS01G0161400 [Xanthoceras sorbifolium]|uniref:Uncharacterized protein n=1 Tax=Xanthoceras sorbifolium TaxID=99658 RepID=A0ABQ8IJJ7_9ROSI|nr:hypothetical protein JRO89_XS01G0161400 [Xanthoceras sorbifolium]
MAASQSRTVNVVDQSRVAPPPGSVSTTTVPLTFLDMPWLFCPLQRIFLYEFSYPTLHFTQNVLPHLKESLSLTLRHFFPFAANLTCPPPPYEPYILYKEGDSIQLTVVESDSDFNHLVGNQAQDVETLQSLVPKLPSTRLSSNTTHVVPVMAIQFTVFPDKGVSIGITYNHAAADARSFHHFVKVWASVHKSTAVDLSSLSLPYHNKDIVKDPNGLSSIFLKDFRSWENSSVGNDPSNNLLVTLVINREKIEQMKHWVESQSKNDDELAQIRITTFVVTCAFAWVNLIKLQEKISGSVDDDMFYYFMSTADCRERFEFSSIPGTYFENWVSNSVKAVKSGCLVSVAGSPKFRVYETDFGWGRPKKSEAVHIGAYGAFSLHESREEEGGVQIGFVVERDKLDLFNAVFDQQGLDIH